MSLNWAALAPRSALVRASSLRFWVLARAVLSAVLSQQKDNHLQLISWAPEAEGMKQDTH